MSTFNKVVTVVALVFAILVLLLLAAIPDRIMAAIAEAATAVQPFVSATAGRLAMAGVALVLCAGMATLLYLELRPRSSRQIAVTSVEGGTAQVTAAAVARQLERRLSELPNIRGVTATVRQRREGVVASIVLDTLSGASVPEATSATIALARRFLESEVGARVAAVHVRVREVANARIEFDRLASAAREPNREAGMAPPGEVGGSSDEGGPNQPSSDEHSPTSGNEHAPL